MPDNWLMMSVVLNDEGVGFMQVARHD